MDRTLKRSGKCLAGNRGRNLVLSVFSGETQRYSGGRLWLDELLQEVDTGVNEDFRAQYPGHQQGGPGEMPLSRQNTLTDGVFTSTTGDENWELSHIK